MGRQEDNMPIQTVIRFNRSCPTCGRRVQIRASLLGSTVSCQHCNAEFTASANDDAGEFNSECRLMARVERALERSAESATNSTVV
jgi:ribosomal protein L37AE/L43A